MSAFTIYPAIDLRQGQVVRLAQGDLQRQTVYSADPGEAARRWLKAGAQWLHVVNLDGAFEQGDQANLLALQAILQAAGEFSPQRYVQFGGGLRSLAAAERVLQAGVQRVVLGTAALAEPGLPAEAVRRFGAQRVAAGLDARNDIVMLRGWTESSGLSASEAAQRLAQAGVHTLIFTDITRDGMGAGLNLASTQALARQSGLEVIASGGVRTQDDVRQAHRSGLAGVIVGRALYEGTLALEDALKFMD